MLNKINKLVLNREVNDCPCSNFNLSPILVEYADTTCLDHYKKTELKEVIIVVCYKFMIGYNSSQKGNNL
jgi:hypothetical protein